MARIARRIRAIFILSRNILTRTNKVIRVKKVDNLVFIKD